jgi:hypothetical protein
MCSAAACVGQPSADDLWGRPGQSGAQDAHATLMGTGGGVAFQGDGIVVFKPRTALSLHLQTRAGALPGELDLLQVDGLTYQRTTSDQKWARSDSPAPDPTGVGASDPQMVGQETIGNDRAWHLRASRGGYPVDLWVRMNDGYPVQAATRNSAGTVFTFRYDRFNTRDRVVAPLGIELMPPARHLTGHVGDALQLNAARIAVVSYDADAGSDDVEVQPRPGNRFVVVEVSVENTGDSPLSTFLDWRLGDATGDTWRESLAVREPSFVGGELAPGESARGFLTYEVSRAASVLVLTVKLDDDTAAFTLA